MATNHNFDNNRKTNAILELDAYNNSDAKIDNILRRELYVSDYPNSNLLHNLKNQLQSEEIEMSKPKRRFFGTVAATIAAIIILSTTVIAAGLYFSNFERLREIVGNQQADILQPVDNGTATVSEDIHIEVVAIGVFYNIVDIYVTLEDLAGNRLDGELNSGEVGSWGLWHHIRARDARMVTGMPPEIIHRSECGIVTLHLRSEFDREITEDEITITFTDISYVAFFDENYRINLNLQELISTPPETTFATREQLAEYRMFSTRWAKSDSFLFFEFEDEFGYDGLYLLTPHQHAIDLVSVEGMYSHLSGIGVIDGRLHVQLYESDPIRPSALVTLRDPDGEVVPAWMLLAHGAPDIETLGYGVFSLMPVYSEAIFEIDRLEDYHLYAFISLMGTINLNWEVTLPIVNSGHLAIDELGIEYRGGAAILHEIRINPVTIMVYGDFPDLRGQGGVTERCEFGRLVPVGNEDFALPFNNEYFAFSMAGMWGDIVYDGFGRRIPRPGIRIFTTDGVAEATQISYARPGGSEFSLTFTIDGVLDLESVVAVEVNGERLYF